MMVAGHLQIKNEKYYMVLELRTDLRLHTDGIYGEGKLGTIKGIECDSYLEEIFLTLAECIFLDYLILLSFLLEHL